MPGFIISATHDPVGCRALAERGDRVLCGVYFISWHSHLHNMYHTHVCVDKPEEQYRECLLGDKLALCAIVAVKLWSIINRLEWGMIGRE